MLSNGKMVSVSSGSGARVHIITTGELAFGLVVGMSTSGVELALSRETSHSNICIASSSSLDSPDPVPPGSSHDSGCSCAASSCIRSRRILTTDSLSLVVEDMRRSTSFELLKVERTTPKGGQRQKDLARDPAPKRPAGPGGGGGGVHSRGRFRVARRMRCCFGALLGLRTGWHLNPFATDQAHVPV
jgi:hypothetical protein